MLRLASPLFFRNVQSCLYTYRNPKFLRSLLISHSSLEYSTRSFATQNQGHTRKPKDDKKISKPPKEFASAPKSEIPKPVFTNETPKGKKKDLSGPMADAYYPQAVESAWYDWWEAEGFFRPQPGQRRFSMVIPPPNVTGALHVGHALTNAIQDAIVRWNRMKKPASASSGDASGVVWVPGTDHAGIATQTVVEKMLARSAGLSRHQLGRDAFVREVWKWKEKYGGTITTQLRRLGSSLDWSREVFTMDQKLSLAVQEAFCRLHAAGLLYREQRLVNWVCALNTAIADIEVDSMQLTGPTKIRVPGYGRAVEFGVQTRFAYPLEDGSGELVVATTRPETMLADTAVAVHPDDQRYRAMIGKFVVHPFSNARLPVIADAMLVDPAYGTGVVKITPAHDPNDYECAKRNNLPLVNLLADDGSINAAGGKFAGMHRYAAREAVVAALKERNLFRGTEPNPMKLDRCSRSGDIIEPLLKPQWYVNCSGMASAALEAVKSGQLQLVPAHHQDAWARWLGDARDWCVSRQLWWGHRIPAYLVHIHGRPPPDPSKTESYVVARSKEQALAQASQRFGVAVVEITLEQDPDVLDTWFSSALFPFSVFGWPNDTEDLRKFYPTTLLETGQDILFFWVARMVMMGLQLTGQLPFKQVLLHGIVRDAHGEKMSKSKGNVIDPLDVVEGITLPQLLAKLEEGNLSKNEITAASEVLRRNFPKGIAECGSDALRLGLCSYSDQDDGINIDPNKILVYRTFCNKLWQATKFAMMKWNARTDFVPSSDPIHVTSLMDRWILSRLANAAATANRAFEQLDLSTAADVLYRFWWEELCSVYIEAIKPVFPFDGSQPSPEILARQPIVQQILFRCFEQGLRLLHPFMPYITEELWQRLPGKRAEQSISVAEYPSEASHRDAALELVVKRALSISAALRSLKAINKLTRDQKTEAYVRLPAGQSADELRPLLAEVTLLAFVQTVKIISALDTTPPACATMLTDEGAEVLLKLPGGVAETTRLEKQVQELKENQTKLCARIAQPTYSRVPADVQTKDREKLELWAQQIVAAEKQLADLKKV